MKKLIPLMVCVATILSLAACGMERVLWKDVKSGNFTKFYYTVLSSAYPPEYQRYRWTGDKSRLQEFSFAGLESQSFFLRLFLEIKSSTDLRRVLWS